MAATALREAPAALDALADQFWRDGALCLRGAFDAGWVERMRAASDRVLEQARAGALPASLAVREGRSIGAHFLWTVDRDFRDFVFASPAAEIAARLLRSPSVRLFKDHLFAKEPGGDEPTPWHQDLPYWCVEGRQVCSIWLALDPVDRANGAVEFVRGSHAWTQRFRKKPFAGAVASAADSDLDLVPDVDAERDKYDVAGWDMEPGDCIVFHALTLHGAPANRSTRRRRGLSTRWLGEDMRYRPHAEASQPFKDPGLAPGAVLESEVFPLVWQRSV